MTTHKHTLFLTRQFFRSLTIKQNYGPAFRWLRAHRNLSFLLAGSVATIFTLASVSVRAAKDSGVKLRPGNSSVAQPAVAPGVPKVAMGTNIVVNWADANNGNGATAGSFHERLIIRNLATGETLLSTILFYDESATGNGPIGRAQLFSAARVHC